MNIIQNNGTIKGERINAMIGMSGITVIVSEVLTWFFSTESVITE